MMVQGGDVMSRQGTSLWDPHSLELAAEYRMSPAPRWRRLCSPTHTKRWTLSVLDGACFCNRDEWSGANMIVAFTEESDDKASESNPASLGLDQARSTPCSSRKYQEVRFNAHPVAGLFELHRNQRALRYGLLRQDGTPPWSPLLAADRLSSCG